MFVKEIQVSGADFAAGVGAQVTPRQGLAAGEIYFGSENRMD
jgi:hypothetical protein